MKRAEKEKIVADLHERLTRAKAVFLTDFRGQNVESLNRLRRDLRQGGDEYQVVKNTLFFRGFSGNSCCILERPFVGPCGITVSYQDPVASAKILADFAKTRETFVLRGGVLEGKTISGGSGPAVVQNAFSEVLLSQVLASLIAVPTGFGIYPGRESFRNLWEP